MGNLQTCSTSQLELSNDEWLESIINEGEQYRSPQVLFRYFGVYASRIDTTLLHEPEEKAFHASLLNILPRMIEAISACNYNEVYALLSSLIDVVNGFFDSCMVNDPDLAIRQNRLALCALADAMYKSFADFTKIVVKEPKHA